MAADPTTSRTVDDILLEDAYFDSEDDPFNDTRPPKNTERDDKAVLSPRKRKAVDDDVFGRDIDEEVKITKQRKKIPKLDAERLLSEPGIPRVRKLLRSGQFQKKLRLKGKGHEFTDAARLLNYYQLWLDSLYPRAKFMDAIQLVEKAGHTKKMQMYRKSWIDEGKPGHIRQEDVDKAIENQDTTRAEAHSNTTSLNQSSALPDPADEDPSLLFFAGDEREEAAGGDGPDDDELDALMAQGPDDAIPPPRKPILYDNSEGEDDLDALLAQESTNGRSQATKSQRTQDNSVRLADPKEPDQDDLDALMREDSQKSPQADKVPDDFEDEDFEDLDTLLNSYTATAEPELPVMSSGSHKKPSEEETNTTNSEDVPELVNTVSSSPIPNIDVDELDDLLDEHEANVKKKADAGIVEEFIASSPIPGQDSQ